MEISSIQRRFVAYLIDVVILLIPTLLLAILLKDFSSISYVLLACVNCSYFTYFISSQTQATPGQLLMDICTINLDNSKISVNLAFDRSISQFFLPLINNMLVILIKTQDFLIPVDVLNILKLFITLLITFWYIVACFSAKRQTFHDMIFNTIVVKKGSIKS